MRVELIETKTAKELTDQLNNFLEHVNSEYKDDPYVEVFQPSEISGRWRAFVFFKKKEQEQEQ